jgi:hypothetical protein
MAREIFVGANQLDPSNRHENVMTVVCAMVDPETWTVTLVVTHGGDMDLAQYVEWKYPPGTPFEDRCLGIMDLQQQAATGVLHIADTHGALYTDIKGPNFHVDSKTGRLTVIDLCVTPAADLDNHPQLFCSGFYTPPEASVRVILSGLRGAEVMKEGPEVVLDMLFARVPASVRSSLECWCNSYCGDTPLSIAGVVWSLSALFSDLMFPKAAVAVRQLATRYDSEHPLTAAAANGSSLGGEASSFLVCLDKDLRHLEELRPYPALYTLLSGGLAVDPDDRFVTLTGMLSLLIAAKEEVIQHKALEATHAAEMAAAVAAALEQGRQEAAEAAVAGKMQALLSDAAEREGKLQQKVEELTHQVAHLHQQLAAATVTQQQQQGLEPGDSVVLPVIKLLKSSGGDVASASSSTASEGEVVKPITPTNTASSHQRK